MDAKANTAEIYDFVHPEHKINSDWPVLNVISKKAAIELEANLFKRFQFPIVVKSEDTQLTKYQDIFSDISEDKLFFEMSLPPLSGHAWLAVDRALIYELAEKYFGGKGESRESTQNPILSHTEERLCQYCTDCLQSAMPVAWRVVKELGDPVINRLSIDRMSHGADDQVVAVCNYELSIHTKNFNIQIVYPHGMLEPFTSTSE